MYKRLVIKIGTKVLSDESGNLDESILKNIVAQIAQLKKKGVEVILVTSGAVGSGKKVLNVNNEKNSVSDKQVFAAVGQVRLMSLYSSLFLSKGYICAQVLVTKEDFRDLNHYKNMQECFLNLLRDNIVPVVNENDVTSIKELFFTDNDELAGLVSAQLKADALIILTSVEGVLEMGIQNRKPKLIKEINYKNVNEIKKNITSEKTKVGCGGMITKFGVARKMMSLGITTHIAHGKENNILVRILNNEKIGTKFFPNKKVKGVKGRLAYSEGLTLGAIFVNKCAGDMLLLKENAMSLLPIGITKVIGKFEKGDVIEIRNERNEKIGFGVTSMNSEKIKNIIGKRGGKTVIHYDYMFIE